MLPLLAASMAGFAQTPAAEPAPQTAPSAKPASKAEAEKPVSLDEIRRFVAVFQAVKQAYVDQVDDDTLMHAAIRGLLTDLDPHSAYLDAEASRELTEQATGAYEGLGLEVIQQPDRTLLVISPIDDTPASKAGIRSGDVITAIDGVPIVADSVDEALGTMRGAVGTQTKLTVMRETSSKPLEFTLTRATIRVSSVKVRTLEPGYHYLRLSTFQADTGLEISRKLRELVTADSVAAKGLVLDLRSNPGGLLNAAVEAADAFLDDGVIVSTRGRSAYSSSEFKATPGDLLKGAPIVILVDGGTASAAEVLAGALRDHHRALVAGSTTFGKGSVQTVLPLDNGDAIKVTTARYYTPNGTSIQASGIVPDVVLSGGNREETVDTPATIRERDLPRHLRGDNETGAIVNVEPIVPRATELDDGDVREALNLLKGLSVFGKR